MSERRIQSTRYRLRSPFQKKNELAALFSQFDCCRFSEKFKLIMFSAQASVLAMAESVLR